LPKSFFISLLFFFFRHKDYQIFSAFVPSRSQGLCDTTQSACLYNTVVFAELFDSTLTAEQLKARNDPLTFNGNISQIFFDQRKLWSTYHDSRYYNLSVSPSPTTKVLILGSDLDSQTPIQGTITFKENINTTSNMVTFLIFHLFFIYLLFLLFFLLLFFL